MTPILRCGSVPFPIKRTVALIMKSPFIFFHKKRNWSSFAHMFLPPQLIVYSWVSLLYVAEPFLAGLPTSSLPSNIPVFCALADSVAVKRKQKNNLVFFMQAVLGLISPLECEIFALFFSSIYQSMWY